MTLEAAQRAIEVGREKMEAKRSALAEIENDLRSGAGGGAASIEMEEKLIDGARATVAKLDAQIEDAQAVQTRFRDQETLRVRRDRFRLDVDIFSAISAALGPRGRQGEILQGYLDTILGPAQRLVDDALPEHVLSVEMFDERGKPALRVGLAARADRDRRLRPWKALSGAERGIVGAALALSLVSDRSPLILALECETMDGATQGRVLGALVGMAGPTAVLATSHHPHGIEEPWASHQIAP
jgi:hypothetical protein